MKTTGSVQEKNGRFYFVINLYDANGKRKIKWISTGLTVRGNKRKAESMLREVLLHYDETGELPTGRGGAYEKVDAKTAKPLPQHLQPVSKSEMLFLDYLNEWVQVHKASIQPATFISYNRMITGRITQYFEPLGLKLCEVTPQVLDEFQEKILLEGYTTNTVIHYHAIFGKAFKDAARRRTASGPTSTPRMKSSSCWKYRRMTPCTCASSLRPTTVCAAARYWG